MGEVSVIDLQRYRDIGFVGKSATELIQEQLDQHAEHLASARLDVPPALITPEVLAQARTSSDSLYSLLMQSGIHLDAYSDALRTVHAFVAAHPEQVDTVRLMGGDEQDLVTALLAQWVNTQLAAQQPEAQQASAQTADTTADTTAQAVTTDGSSSTPDDAASIVLPLAGRRRKSGQRAKSSGRQVH